MLNRVIATVEKYGLLEKGDSVIVERQFRAELIPRLC